MAPTPASGEKVGCECPVPSFLPGELWDSPAPHRLLIPRGGRHPHFSHRSKDKAEKPGGGRKLVVRPTFSAPWFPQGEMGTHSFLQTPFEHLLCAGHWVPQ